MEQLEFCTFLLHVGNELTAKQFEQLKFFLKGFISSGTCKEIQEVCHNFEERERELFLTPAHLGILKMALDAIGRPDLVKKIEEKEQYFTDLFRQQVQAGDNLEPRGLFEFILRHSQNYPSPAPFPLPTASVTRGV